MYPIAYPTPPPAATPQPVRFPDLSGEWRIFREATRLLLSSPQMLRAPRGRGEAVLLIPGWRAPQASMDPLRRLLRRKGYDARHWGEGVNRGDVEQYLGRLVPRTTALAQDSGQRVALVGWSLGGVIAREIARELPDTVSCVITYGSPIIGGPVYTAAASAYSDTQRQTIVRRIDERERERPITRPIAAVFSRIDGIVDWRACIDRLSPRVVHYEVDSTHLSMGIDPTVWRVVLDTLAAQRPAP
jgi:pimeloyl-ACP methyl ester carboxylesterase